MLPVIARDGLPGSIRCPLPYGVRHRCITINAFQSCGSCGRLNPIAKPTEFFRLSASTFTVGAGFAFTLTYRPPEAVTHTSLDMGDNDPGKAVSFYRGTTDVGVPAYCSKAKVQGNGMRLSAGVNR